MVSSSCLPFFDCKSDCKKRANGRVQPRCGAQRSNVGCNGVGPPAHLRTPDGISRVSVCICQHPAFYLLTPSLLPRDRHGWSVMLSPAPRWSPYQFDALGCAVEHAGLRMEPPWGFHHELSCDRIKDGIGPDAHIGLKRHVVRRAIIRPRCRSPSDYRSLRCIPASRC